MTSRFRALVDQTGGIAERMDDVMELIQVVTAAILIVVFAIGVGDLAFDLATKTASGEVTDADGLVSLVDTALVLFIVVEIYRTVVAYAEDGDVLPLVVEVGVIAMARKIISFRTGKYPATDDALLGALSYGLLLVVLVAAYGGIYWTRHRTGMPSRSEVGGAGRDDVGDRDTRDDVGDGDTRDDAGPAGATGPHRR